MQCRQQAGAHINGDLTKYGWKTPWAHEINDIRQPVDNRLWNTSSWKNYFTKRDKVAPKGWRVEA